MAPKNKARSAAGSVAGSAKNAALPAATADAEAAYARYLPLAQKLAADTLIGYRIDPLLGYHNVQLGLDALAPHLTALGKALPLLDWKALRDLPALAQAVIFAATQVAGPLRSTGELAARRSEAAVLRDRLLRTAELLVLDGIFTASAVAKIRAGHGPIDQARDCVALAALFRKQPDALKRQLAVTAAHVERASELGTELLGRLQPQRARTSRQKSDPVAVAAIAARDRLGTLLWLRHNDLRRAGYYQFGDALDQHVPSLQSGRSARRKSTPIPAATPAAG